MFEKVNPSHPDKIADRIAGAVVDLAYKEKEDPHIAVEVLIGHGKCFMTVEADVIVDGILIDEAVDRIAGQKVDTYIVYVPQDEHLNKNQKEKIRCGDNGIFKGVPVSEEEKELSDLARKLYGRYPYDGKFIIDGELKAVCQSHASTYWLRTLFPDAKVNPLGDWTGGIDVDTGATNRKLGSDMGRGVTGGGLHGKDLSKADVSVNIYAHLKAQETGKEIELRCAIGDEEIDNRPYSEIVEIARGYIREKGGFEKFAEWGLI